MPKFRKKPVVIEAIQYTGKNFDTEILPFTGAAYAAHRNPEPPPGPWPMILQIMTAEGPLTASPGDWIIKGVKGEFYPCKPDIFAATYDPAE